MLHMKNDFNKKIQGFIKDLEDASPNIKNTLTEIYPVTFKLNIEGHKDIYISLAKDVKAISFSPIEKIDFEMVSSLTEIFELLVTKKIKRGMFIGDQELAMATDEVVVATVIQLSTRGTVGSDNW